MIAFTNASIFGGEKFLKERVLLVAQGKIKGVVHTVPKGVEEIDCKEGILAPGCVDLQIYGAGRDLFSAELTAESLKRISDSIVKQGTTSYFMTLATNSFDVFRRAVEIVRDNPHPALRGIQLEGPYINPQKRGAHLTAYIKKPDYNELKTFLKFADGVVKMMTLAPEVCDRRVIHLLRDYGVLLSAGHSNATFSEAIRGFDNGITAVTHLYNAMSPLHHRDAGLPGASFLDNRAHASIIEDGIHVGYEAAKIAKQQMGQRLFFITDAVAATMKGGYKHIRKGNRYVLPDGTLSGSALTMPHAISNMVKHVGESVEESLRMASLYPARVAGFRKSGSIKEGYVADLICLSKDLKLNFTVLKGEVIKA
ncbi:MAG TPA: N-acetylglucosamine-6-phosphate deacetylase [Ginsengibacter sp.]|nr:N-acetylglucosamine-6-phosphate deacetylase [Ginsengibacter sp.]